MPTIPQPQVKVRSVLQCCSEGTCKVGAMDDTDECEMRMTEAIRFWRRQQGPESRT